MQLRSHIPRPEKRGLFRIRGSRSTFAHFIFAFFPHALAPAPTALSPPIPWRYFFLCFSTGPACASFPPSLPFCTLFRLDVPNGSASNPWTKPPTALQCQRTRTTATTLCKPLLQHLRPSSSTSSCVAMEAQPFLDITAAIGPRAFILN